MCSNELIECDATPNKSNTEQQRETETVSTDLYLPDYSRDELPYSYHHLYSLSFSKCINISVAMHNEFTRLLFRQINMKM